MGQQDGPRGALAAPCILLVIILALADGIAGSVDLRLHSPFLDQHPEYAASAIMNLTRFRSHWFRRISQSRGNRKPENRGKDHWLYQQFRPFVTCPPGTRLTEFGSGKGRKWTCGYPEDDPSCVIYSIGSDLDFGYEESVLNRTKCQVHTFDCSCKGTSIHPRHTYHEICVGTTKFVYPKRRNTTTHNIMSLGKIAQELGHTQVTAMKCDIEGAEYDMMADWSATDPHLPVQLNVELHYTLTKTYKVKNDRYDIALFMAHLMSLGYAIINKEDNPDYDRCTELLLLRVQTFDFGDVDVGR